MPFQPAANGGGSATESTSCKWETRATRYDAFARVLHAALATSQRRDIACIDDADVIENILTHLDAKVAECEGTRRPPSRVPPQRELFDATG